MISHIFRNKKGCNIEIVGLENRFYYSLKTKVNILVMLLLIMAYLSLYWSPLSYKPHVL